MEIIYSATVLLQCGFYDMQNYLLLLSELKHTHTHTLSNTHAQKDQISLIFFTLLSRFAHFNSNVHLQIFWADS